MLLLFSIMTLGCGRGSENGSAKPENVAAQTLFPQVDELDELLRNRIEAAGIPSQISVGEELVHASIVLPLFYERRVYRPAWSNNYGLLPQADAMIQAIRNAAREGLKPQDYHLARIEAILNEVHQKQEQQTPVNPRMLVDLDLLLTDAFLIYSSHLLAGKINPETIDAEWFANRREIDLAAHLQTALEKNQIEEALRGLLPPRLWQRRGYFYRRQSSGWDDGRFEWRWKIGSSRRRLAL